MPRAKKTPTPKHLPGTKVVLPPKLAPLLVPIDSIAPDPANPRVAKDVEHLANLLVRFGFTDPLGVTADGMIEAGHQRLAAAKLLGATHVPTVVLAHDPTTAAAYNLAHNQAQHVVSGWDEPARNALLAKLHAEDEALTAQLGWGADELAAMLAPPPEGEGTGDGEPPAVEPPTDPVCQPGDILEMGPHRVVCGDCRDPLVVDLLLGDERINVAFTSPPYASQRKYDESSGFKPIPPDKYVDWFEAVQANVRAHLADDGSWFVNIKEHCDDGERDLYVKDLTIAHKRQWGWRYVDELCWVRGGVPGKWSNRFKNAWEPVFHFAASSEVKLVHGNVQHETDCARDYRPDNPKTHSGFISGGANRREGLALPSNVVTVFSGPSQVFTGAEKHTATFPIGLPRFFILAYSDAGDIIFDPFMGSGTTMLAADGEGRVARGCEISPAYCDVIAIRWLAKSGHSAEVVRAGERFKHPGPAGR